MLPQWPLDRQFQTAETHRNRQFMVKIRLVNLLSALLLSFLCWESLSTQRNLARKLHGQISNINKPPFLQKHLIWYERREFKCTLTELRNSYQISELEFSKNLTVFHAITQEKQPNTGWLGWVAITNMMWPLQREDILRIIACFIRQSLESAEQAIKGYQEL